MADSLGRQQLNNINTIRYEGSCKSSKSLLLQLDAAEAPKIEDFMKKYVNPETKCLSVNAQTVICTSAEAPQRQGQLGTMTVTTGEW